MRPFYERQLLRFDCTRCGRRCVAGGGYYVFLDENEAEEIRTYLQLSRSWFRRRYLSRSPDGDLVVSWQSDGRCWFLDERGGLPRLPGSPRAVPHVSLLARGR